MTESITPRKMNVLITTIKGVAMREFRTICKDAETKGIMVLSEASYNGACYYLESKGFECDTARSISDRFTEIIGKLNGKAKTFLYDEHRGYLINMEG